MSHRLGIILTLFFIACSNSQEHDVESTTLATVGNVKINTERLQRAFHALYTNPSERTSINERKSLDRLIDIEVLLLEARKRNLHNDIRVKNKVLETEQELLSLIHISEPTRPY